MERTYTVGERVRVKRFRGVREDEVQCDTGTIIAAHIRHFRTPMERIDYTVKFDKPYLKEECVLYKNIVEITVEADRIE